ncbi:MAG: translation initiation factor IF-2 [Minisyncoccia bacterium]
MIRYNSMKEARPPVVAVMGHIDHGKSTLIDYIRKTNIVEKEAGGITQHIGAYEVMHTLKDGRNSRITFLDTPGHEAFSSIRTRGADIADVVVVVVSAEDGVKPQTVEVFKYIKENSLPYLVAITKVDKPSADIERTKQNLAENEIYVEGYGGDTPVVQLSGKTGQGVDDLFDMITLMTDMEGKTADRETLGSGVIIESRIDAKRGVTGVGIIKDGTVRPGLFAASLGAVAPMRFILDAEGNDVEELSFSSPVQIMGWDEVPVVGAEFKTFLKKEEALAFAESEKAKSGEKKSGTKADENLTYLPLIIRTDTAGSLEAIESELGKLSRERIVPKIIISGVGKISENDVKSVLTSSSATIIGFHTKVEAQAAALAERSGIPILLFDIIYELTDKVKKLLSDREPKIEVEEVSSTCKVLKLFGATKDKQVVGGRVLTGTLKRGDLIKIVRREAEIGQGKVKELQQSKIATDTAIEGTEFGAMVESKMEIAPGDVLSAITMVIK